MSRCFQSKLLDALKIDIVSSISLYLLCGQTKKKTFWLWALPTVLVGSFEFFIDLLRNLLANTLDSLQAVVSPLEPLHWCTSIYNHLLTCLFFSPINDVKDLSYSLARAAMFSTGAFDKNLDEVWAWLLLLPG
ncbi:hypothetical protein CFP56_040669 [Quercus suber]|uniref:Uncharacterized protein n=1 Tax=Quercus suber TaxID=58331 RepID=A0AAW0IXY5_QUESU